MIAPNATERKKTSLALNWNCISRQTQWSAVLPEPRCDSNSTHLLPGTCTRLTRLFCARQGCIRHQIDTQSSEAAIKATPANTDSDSGFRQKIASRRKGSVAMHTRSRTVAVHHRRFARHDTEQPAKVANQFAPHFRRNPQTFEQPPDLLRLSAGLCHSLLTGCPLKQRQILCR